MFGLCPKVCWLPWKQEDDTELEEAAAPYDEDFLLVRAIMTGRKYYEEGERDVDALVAAAMEAIEGDVTDQDMLMDLIQMIRDVFDQVGLPCHTERTGIGVCVPWHLTKASL